MSEIGELFSKDPQTITDEEFKKVIEHYRKERHKLVEAENTGNRAPTGKKLSKAKREPKKSPPKDLSLDDLGDLL